MHAVTMDPATFCGRSCKNICDGFATGIKPRPGTVLRPLHQNHLRRIRDRHQAATRHLENTNLVRSAVTVLHRSYDAMIVMSLAFEIEHRIDDVFERSEERNRAFFRDVADQKHGYA